MDEVLNDAGGFSTEREQPGDAVSGRGQFGAGPTALLTMPAFSTRISVIVLCMVATGTQLMMRSLPFVAVIGKDGMAMQYGWGEEDVGNLYAAFGWGYALSQIPGSMLAQHYGHKNVWLTCLTGAACMNLFVPLATSLGGLSGAMAVRFLFGLFQGPLFPIQAGLLAAWLHENERSTLNAIVGLCWALFQGIQGFITPYFMAGVGWEWAFVFYSLLVFVWARYWREYGVGIVPSMESRCSKAEAAYLSGESSSSDGPPPFDLTIWWSVVKQPVVWGMALFTVIDGMGKPVFLTYVPQYLVTQLDFDISSAGAISALPFLANSLGSILAGVLADRLHIQGISNVFIRRVFTMGPQLVYMIAALFLANGVGTYFTIFLLVFAQFAEGFTGSGIWIKSIDISKRYSSIAHGFLNGCGNVTYYALSGSLIGRFLEEGGGYFGAMGRCKLSVAVPDNDWKAWINGTIGPIGECRADDGTEATCISQTCAGMMDQCMKQDAQLIIDSKMEVSMDLTDVELCRETWNQLFLMSGGICILAGVLFWVTTGVEEIDSIIDPIAIRVARKRGWSWGESL